MFNMLSNTLYRSHIQSAIIVDEKPSAMAKSKGNERLPRV